MKQLELFECSRPLVVFRVREDERIEVRWPDEQLVTTFRDWCIALDMMSRYEINPVTPFANASVRVRCSSF